jgi:hypothetical protein
MTVTMVGYSALFMRFAWAVQPRNYILFACHSFNVTAQLNQLRRAVEYKMSQPGGAEAVSELGQKVGAAVVGLVTLIASHGRVKSFLTQESMPGFVKSISAHPVG